MKICSFLPSATEILFALGLGDSIVGVTHECFYPPEAKAKRRVVDSVIDQERCSSEEIDAIVREHLARRASLYRVDLEALRELRPDLIVTQELCEVCAIDAANVLRAIHALPHQPTVVSLHAHTLREALDDILRVGAHTGRAEEATRLVETLTARIERVKRLVETAPARPRVFCLEWLKPMMGCGHWVPEMVELAGGREVVGKAGKPSHYVAWKTVLNARPEVLCIMPCGFPLERTRRELSSITSLPGWQTLPAVEQRRVYLVNGPAYFNQSGPRLVDGLEILAGLMHPERCAHLIPAGAAERLDDALRI